MRPPKFAIEAENSITSSRYYATCYFAIEAENSMRPPKFAIEAENSITSSIYLCDLLSLQ